MFGFERDSPGSGAIELMVLAVVVLFLGLTIWGTFRIRDMHKLTTTKPLAVNAKSTNPTIASTTPPQGSPPVTVPTSPGTSSATQSQNVLDISPIGVDITVPDSLKDLTYYANNQSNGVISVSFSTASLTSAALSCSASVGSGAFDTILKGYGQYPGPANPSSGALITQQPTFYIAYELPTGPCEKDLSPATQALLDSQAQDFYSALASVKVAK